MSFAEHKSGMNTVFDELKNTSSKKKDSKEKKKGFLRKPKTG